MTLPNYLMFALRHLPSYLAAPVTVTLSRFAAFTYAGAAAACVLNVVCMIVEWLT